MSAGAGPLEGKAAIVSGAASGIGEAIARELSAQGASVLVADIDARAGAAVADAVGGVFACVDVTDKAEVDEAAAVALASFGRIDALVNSAGVTRFIEFFEITEEDWNWINNTNARGTFFFLQAAAAAMKDTGGGSVVNIASIAAKGYRHTSSVAYAASKGAIVALTRAAAIQLAPHSIRVNCICPGITVTPLLDKWLAPSEESRSRWAAMLKEVPLGLPNQPSHIATLAAYLVSDLSETITGQSWNVDGGLTVD